MGLTWILRGRPVLKLPRHHAMRWSDGAWVWSVVPYYTGMSLSDHCSCMPISLSPRPHECGTTNLYPRKCRACRPGFSRSFVVPPFSSDRMNAVLRTFPRASAGRACSSGFSRSSVVPPFSQRPHECGTTNFSPRKCRVCRPGFSRSFAFSQTA